MFQSGERGGWRCDGFALPTRHSGNFRLVFSTKSNVGGVAFALKFSSGGNAMFYDKAVLSAHYAIRTEALGLRMDAEAREIVAPYMPRDLGARTLLPSMERDIQWELSQGRAERAKAELEQAGFRTRLRLVEVAA